MAAHELNIVVLEERTKDGWAGAAAITCPCGCGVETVYTVTSSLNGRGIGFWQSSTHAVVDRKRIKP